MSDYNKIKKIENKQWTVEELVKMVEMKQISKPKFQRQRRWITLPDKNKSKSVAGSYQMAFGPCCSHLPFDIKQDQTFHSRQKGRDLL